MKRLFNAKVSYTKRKNGLSYKQEVWNVLATDIDDATQQIIDDCKEDDRMYSYEVFDVKYDVEMTNIWITKGYIK